MKHFFRTGRGLPFVKGERFSNQSKQYKPIILHSHLSRDKFAFTSLIGYRLAIVPSVNVSQSIEKRKRIDDGAPNNCRKEGEGGASAIEVDSTLVLPLDYICSTCDPEFHHRSFIQALPGSDCQTEPRRSADGAPSEKSRTWLGLGRYLAWASFGLSSVIHCLSVGYSLLIYGLFVGSPTKEQATKKQGNLLVEGSSVTAESFETKSGLVRDLFDRCASIVRRYVEAQSNKSRRYAEAVSSLSRTCLEEGSKSSRETVEQEPKDSRRVDDLNPWKGTRMYSKGTGKVLKVGGKGTGDVLESYQTATKYAPTASKSTVAYQDLGEVFTVACSQVGKRSHLQGVFGVGREAKSMFANGVSVRLLIISCFKERCRRFCDTLVSMLGFDFKCPQIALKCVSVISINQWASAIKVAASLIIFCVLFSSAKAQSPTKVGAAAKAQPRGKLGIVAKDQQQQEIIKDIRGTVIDAVTKKPLDEVQISIHIDSVFYVGRRSFNGGKFDFKGAHLQKGKIRFFYKGYQTKELNISNSNNGPYNVSLQPESIAIEEVEVVSTGYFSVPKERATGSFTHINNELLSRSVGSNVIDRLKDVVPGLTFNQRQIGKSTISNEPSISIRGRSTIKGNAEPLIVLDNFPYEGNINDINPEDIESVTVLQDAAAASIWGARAGNGVIVLNLKKGALERPLRTTVHADYSISAKPDLYYAPTMSMNDFIEVERFLFNKNAWNAYINQGYSYITPAVELLKQHRDKKLTDMELESALDVLKKQDVRPDLDKYYYRPGSLRKVSASFDGGGKANTYYFSAGYDQNVGTQVGADNKRLSLNARNSYQLWQNKLRFDMGLLFSKSKQSYTAMSGNQYNVLYDRWADENGNALSIGGGNTFRQSYIDTAGNGLLRDWNYRPLEDIGINSNWVDDLNYQLNAGVTVKPLPWLSASIQYRYNSGNSHSQAERDVESFYIRNLYNKFSQIDYTNNIVKSAIPNGGQLNGTRKYSDQHNGRFQLDVNQTWGMHQVALLGGAEINHYGTLGQIDATQLGYKLSTETYTPFDLSINYRQYHTRSLGPLLVQPINPTRESTVNRNVLAFVNGSYTYDRKYTGTFSIRKDEANIFGVEANERGKPFWSVGLLWHLHDEDFVKLPWIQRLSLRATHGVMGNVSTASALLTSAVSPYVDYDSKRIFQTIVTPPNPMLSWEKVQMTNLAADFSVLNGMLSGVVERYFRKSTDLLSYNPMAPTSGVTRLYGNWSSMKSSGWDVTLTSRQFQGAFNWSSNLIFSHIKDVVTDYKEKPSSDRQYLTSNIGAYPVEGMPLNMIYSLRYAGLDNSGNPIGYLDGAESTDYTKIYNNTALTDYVYHGRATPNTFGSLRNNFGYKSIDLSFTLSYHLGYYFRQSGFSPTSLYSVLGYGSTPFQYQYSDRWQQAGDELKTRIPAALYPVNGNRESFYAMAEDHVQQGDHIRFRDIRLAYSFPNLKNNAFKSMQVYAYVGNVGVLWAANKEGYDPQAVPNGNLLFPTPRTYSFGINLNI